MTSNYNTARWEELAASLARDEAAAAGAAPAGDVSAYEKAAEDLASPKTAPAYTPKVVSIRQAASTPKSYPGTTLPQSSAQPAKETKTYASDDVVIGTKTLSEIRADFPILTENIHGYPIAWFDNGATTQRPKSVIDRLSEYYLHENSNVHRGVHELANRSTDAYEGAREKIARFLNAPSANDIVFVRGTTEGINLVAYAYVRPLLEPGDEIIVSLLEHHANIVPWQLIAEETGARIRVIPVDESGQLDIRACGSLFNRHTKFVSVTAVSNVLGTITPIAELIQIAHAHGVPILIDGAQSTAHLPIDLTALNADFYVFSGHKIYGPNGIGAVYGRHELWEAARPWQGGGNMIKDVTFERTIYNEVPNKFEAGTGSIADAVGLGAAVDYLASIGMAAVAEREHELTQYALKEMARVPGLHLVGHPTAKSGVLSFVLDGHSIEEVGSYLDRYGIAVRAGHHCAQPILRHFGLEGTVRPVLGLYNPEAEVDRMVRALRALV